MEVLSMAPVMLLSEKLMSQMRLMIHAVIQHKYEESRMEVASLRGQLSALKAILEGKDEPEESIEYKICHLGSSVTVKLQESDSWEGALLQFRGVLYDFDDLLHTVNRRKTQKWKVALISWRHEDILDYLAKMELEKRIENINYHHGESVNLNLERSNKRVFKWPCWSVSLDLPRFRMPFFFSYHSRLAKTTTNQKEKTCSMKVSSEGGFDIEIGSYPIHVPKYSSVHHPLVQMVLFARTMYAGTLTWLKFVASKRFVELNKSNLVITKPKSHSPNTVSARKDVQAHADAALENHSVTPGLDKNISKLGELDYNVDLSTVRVHSGGFPQDKVYNLHSLTSAPNSADHGITKPDDEAELWPLPNTAAKAEDRTEVTWLIATAALNHATGNRDLLSGFTTMQDCCVKAGDGVSMPVCGRGSVITGTVVLPDVWYVPGLTENLVSAIQLTELNYSVGFARGACIIKSATDGVVTGKARASEDGLFEVEFLKVQSVSPGEWISLSTKM